MHLSTHNWMRAEPLEVTLKRIKHARLECCLIHRCDPVEIEPLFWAMSLSSAFCGSATPIMATR